MQGVFVLIDLTYVFKFAADLVVKPDTTPRHAGFRGELQQTKESANAAAFE